VVESRWQRWLETRHIWLLVSLVCLEIIYPLSRSVYQVFGLLELFFAVGVLTCLFAAAAQRRYLMFAVILAVPSLFSFASVFGLSLFHEETPDWLVWIRLITITSLFSFSAILIISDVLRADRINIDKICAVVSVYLMLGVIWALFYAMAELYSPGAIELPSWPEHTMIATAGFEHFSALTYFSFVTLTTLGYGEIVPLTPVTRMLAWLEAVVGQLYVAVLIAKIVALHVAHKTEKN